MAQAFSHLSRSEVSVDQVAGAITDAVVTLVKNTMHTVRYTELSPERFKNFWED